MKRSKKFITNPEPALEPSRMQIIKNDLKRNKSIYIMAIPVLLFYLVFCYMPMYGAIIAFKDFKPSLGIMGSEFVGFKHFINLFTSPSFFQVFKNTLRISLSLLIFGFPAPIILALLLNELRSSKFAKVVQNFTYMPHFISLVVICGLIRTFTLDTGIIPYIMSWFGLERVSLLNYPQYFTTVFVASDIWQTIGWNSIIYLAALTGVDSQLYEAAMIDGANRWKQTIHVTIPSIMPTIIIMLILKIGQVLNVGFEKIILLYSDTTMSVADVLSSYTYRKGLIDLSWSFSSAVGLFNSVINFIFLLITNYISRRVGEVSLW